VKKSDRKKVYDRDEWKKLLRTARNHRILHMPIERNRMEFTNPGLNKAITLATGFIHVSHHSTQNRSYYKDTPYYDHISIYLQSQMSKEHSQNSNEMQNKKLTLQ
jgi:hypothetical protein